MNMGNHNNAISISPIHFFLLAVITLVSCVEDSDTTPEPNKPTDQFIPCNQTVYDAIDLYLDTTWTTESIREFIQGSWRLHGGQGYGSDTVQLTTIEKEFRFSETTLEVYEPYDSLKATGGYTIESSGTGNTFFKLKATGDDIIVDVFAFGNLVPCNSELIFWRSYLDREDWFYRKVD